MYSERRKLLEQIEDEWDAKPLLYVTGDRGGDLQTQIAPDQVPLFVDHLDKIGLPDRLALVLYTRGGVTLAAWSIVNMLRQFADHLTVIVPLHCHSAGTLLSLGADEIVMTKQATLGPIDPSVNTALNPPVPGKSADVRVPISVEDVAGYFDLAKEIAELDRKTEAMSAVMQKLVDNVHPLALGGVFRAREQIKKLARKLLDKHYGGSEADKDKIISVLCSEAGSHDYSIYRREAKDELKLPIVKPSAAQYTTIKALYDDFAKELNLRNAFNAVAEFAGKRPGERVSVKRSPLESIEGGAHFYESTFILTSPLPKFQAQRLDEWKHEAP